MAAKVNFEDALEKLEGIVNRMESGDLQLEESLKLFEEGISLTRLCNQKLDEVEKKVAELLKASKETGEGHPPAKGKN